MCLSMNELISLCDIMARAPATMEVFLPWAPWSQFHGCVEECCVVPPCAKESERYESFHQSVIISSPFFLISSVSSSFF